VAPGRGVACGRACDQWAPSTPFQAGLAQIRSDRELPRACLGTRRAGPFCDGSAQWCRIVEMLCAVKRTVLVAR
jgi:hypothetical protein